MFTWEQYQITRVHVFTRNHTIFCSTVSTTAVILCYICPWELLLIIIMIDIYIIHNYNYNSCSTDCTTHRVHVTVMCYVAIHEAMLYNIKDPIQIYLFLISYSTCVYIVTVLGHMETFLNSLCLCVCVCVCVRARACMRACVRVCVCAFYMFPYLIKYSTKSFKMNVILLQTYLKNCERVCGNMIFSEDLAVDVN